VTATALAVLALTGSPVSTTVDVSPRAVPFGDAVVARATVAVEANAVDPEDVVVRVRTGAFTKVSERREWTRSGGLAVLSLRVRFACSSAACVPINGARRVRIPPLRVGSRLVSWPPVDVLPRVPASAVEAVEPAWTIDDSPPAPTFRVAPNSAVAVLGGVAALLTLLGVALLAVGLRQTFPRRPGADSALERALARVRASLGGDLGERRRALGTLARVLASTDRSLAQSAAELAWAEPGPAPDATEALAARIERRVTPP
jgi:hypothetical protein